MSRESKSRLSLFRVNGYAVSGVLRLSSCMRVYTRDISDHEPVTDSSDSISCPWFVRPSSHTAMHPASYPRMHESDSESSPMSRSQHQTSPDMPAPVTQDHQHRRDQLQGLDRSWIIDPPSSSCSVALSLIQPPVPRSTYKESTMRLLDTSFLMLALSTIGCSSHTFTHVIVPRHALAVLQARGYSRR